MFANYHTHTVRCHHASGSEREFIESAVKGGIKILGFADHTPQVFENGYVSGMRMAPEETPEYVATLLKLKEEYKNDIEIHIGFEAEYYAEIFENLRSLCRKNGVEYLILGQHSIGTDGSAGTVWSGNRTDDEGVLERYVDIVVEAIETGSFTYIAHPDVINFTGDEKKYEKEMERLCVRAKELKIPLEINMLGVVENRHYPCDRFFNIAKRIGNDVVIGCDAHCPDFLSNTEYHKRALDYADRLGLNLVETVDLKKI